MLLQGGYTILPYWCREYLPFVIEKQINNCTHNKFLAVNGFLKWSTKSYPSSNKFSIRLAWHLKVPWQLIGKKGIVQMTGPSHYTNFQSNLQVHDKIPAPRHLFFAAWPKMWFENWTLELQIIHHVLKSFKNSAFFLRKITSKSCWCRFMKNCDGNWNVLLAITRVKYFVCYPWSFSQVSLKQAIFFKHIVK